MVLVVLVLSHPPDGVLVLVVLDLVVLGLAVLGLVVLVLYLLLYLDHLLYLDRHLLYLDHLYPLDLVLVVLVVLGLVVLVLYHLLYHLLCHVLDLYHVLDPLCDDGDDVYGFYAIFCKANNFYHNNRKVTKGGNRQCNNSTIPNPNQDTIPLNLQLYIRFCKYIYCNHLLNPFDTVLY